MSLLSTLQIASNALQAQQIGLQVVGNNIANANTPGYIRQSVVFSPAPTQRIGTLTLGLGVQIDGIVQQTDKYLQERLYSAQSDLANGRTQEESFSQLEAIIGELSDTDLSTSLSNFFSSIQDILNQPEDVSVRNLAVLRAQTLTGDIQRLVSRVRKVQEDANTDVINAASDINRLLKDVADLNVKIAASEGGDVGSSDAIGLRDRRGVVLSQLAELIDIRIVEQPSGAVTVFSGGDFLVYDGSMRAVEAVQTYADGLPKAEIQIASTSKILPISSGRVAGLLTARDEILGGFLKNLDNFSQTLINEFNRIYVNGQGLKGYDSLTAERGITNPATALDLAGLPFTPTNGSFKVQIYNTQTGLTQTTDIYVRLSGLDDDTSLNDLAAAIDAIDGLSASIDSNGRLNLSTNSPNVQFAFSSDTSGALAALGLGTFFTGTGAGNIGVNQVVKNDPAKFAASASGIDGDTENAVLLAGFLDRSLTSTGGASIAILHDRLIADVTQKAAVGRAVTEGLEVFQQTLEAQFMAISGVSIDEEAVRMIQYQRAFQASARVIATIDELLETLVNI